MHLWARLFLQGGCSSCQLISGAFICTFLQVQIQIQIGGPIRVQGAMQHPCPKLPHQACSSQYDQGSFLMKNAPALKFSLPSVNAMRASAGNRSTKSSSRMEALAMEMSESM